MVEDNNVFLKSAGRGAAGGSRRPVVVFCIMLAALAAAAAANLRIGSVDASWAQIADVITGRDDSGLIYNIIMELRIPRMCAAALLGGALAVSGFLLQTYFRNPIAGPFVLGISSGSKMAVAAVMIIFSGMAGTGARQAGVNSAADAMNAIFASARHMSSALLIIAAFAGAMLSMFLILLISRVMQNMYMLIVGGIMIGYICTAVTDFMVTFADDSNIVNLHNWSVGSFSGIIWDNVNVIAVVVIPAVLLVFMMSKQIGAFLLGEDYARSMGVDPGKFKAAVILLSSLLSACVTAYAGPVSFVGIAVPHIVRRTLGTARPILVIPACFLCGAGILPGMRPACKDRVCSVRSEYKLCYGCFRRPCGSLCAYKKTKRPLAAADRQDLSQGVKNVRKYIK